MSRDRLLQLLNSGDLYRLACGCRYEKDLAEKLGMSYEKYRGIRRRIRESGTWFPDWNELIRGFGLPPEEPDSVVADLPDFVDEEPTAGRVVAVSEPVVEQVTPEPIAIPRTISDEIEVRKDKATIIGLKRQLSEALDKLAQCRLELVTEREAETVRSSVDPITPREKNSILREATAIALASDWHIEERVDPEAINGVNEYNIDIARHRVERFFSGFNYLIRYHQDHFAIRDALLWLGGDLITGYLREENLEHNELSPVQAIATLHVWLVAGIHSILQNNHLESLKIVCNSGNHGRLTDKVRPSTREANSIEWLLYKGLAREFANEPRVQFSLPHGSQTYVEVYDWTIRFLHGDNVNFQGGVGGITVPLYKALARWETVRHADLTCLGHFHQYHDLSDLVVNGSLIGYNPFALSIGARYEEPRQAFFLIDKRRGKTMPADIWVKDIEEEA